MFSVDFSNKISPQINRLAQLPSGGDALLVAQLATKLQAPCLFVVNDGYQLQRIKSELFLFAPQLRVASFPDYEVLAYERQSPYSELVAERLRVLWQIEHKQIDVLLVQAVTLQMQVPPASFCAQRVLLLKVGMRLDSEKLRTKLSAAGYQCVHQVYAPGEFAVRGSVIDLLLQGQKNPLRIDLFDDEIESIHYFDTKTQKTISSISELEILPAREYPQDRENLSALALAFSTYFPKLQNTQIVTDLKHGLLPAGVEFYLPLFFNSATFLFDYMDEKWQVISFANLAAGLQLNWQEIKKRYDYYNFQYPCLKPSDLFLDQPRVFAQIKRFRHWELAISGSYYLGFAALPQIDAGAMHEILTQLQGYRQIIVCVASRGRLEIIRQTLASRGLVALICDKISELGAESLKAPLILVPAELYNGFVFADICLLSESDLYPQTRGRLAKARNKTPVADNDFILRDLAEINIGDLVVHVNHGIGRY